MPTTALTIGPAHLLAQDQIYALPGKAVYINAEGAGTLETSNDGSTFAALGTTNPVAAVFIRSTVGTKRVTLKSLA